MRIPKRDIAAFAKGVRDKCSASLNERIQRGAMYRNTYLTGDPEGNPQTFNKTNSHIDTLSSFLYSPAELRFDIQHYGPQSPVDKAFAQTASSELHRRLRQSNVDTDIGECVEWALVKGKCFMKLLWGDDGFDGYIIQPEMMGVSQEYLTTLDRQDAFFESTYYTPDRFYELIQNNEEKDQIMRKVTSYLSPDKAGDGPDKANNLKQIILGGINPYQAASSNNSTKNKGIVDWLSGPSPVLAPQLAQSLIRLDELWIWDDEREDYTTIQIVGDDIIIEGKDRHRNLFADSYDTDDPKLRRAINENNPLAGHHPYIEFCPNKLAGYFWGRSELCNVAPLQLSINKRIDGINAIMRKQEDPPRYFSGSQGITQAAFSRSKKAGGYLVDTNPNAKMQSMAPEMPANIFESLHEFEAMFNDMGGTPPVLQGRGESGVRAQGHAQTLTHNASPRFKDRAIIIERQVEELGGLALDLLKAKVGTKMTAWVMPGTKDIRATLTPENDLEEPPVPGMKPVEFIFHDLSKNCRVKVDSHSSSPIFGVETRQLLFDLAKIGAIKPEQVIRHTDPPGKDEMIEDLQKSEIEKAAFAQAHPELAAEQEAKGKKRK